MISDSDIMNWLEDAAARGGYRGGGLADIAVGANGGGVVEVSVATWGDDAMLFAASIVEELGESHDAFYTFDDEEPDAATIIIACDRVPWGDA